MAEHTYGPFGRKALDGGVFWAKPTQGSPNLFERLTTAFPGRPFRVYAEGVNEFVVLKDDPALTGPEEITLAAEYLAWDPTGGSLDTYKAEVITAIEFETNRRITDLGFDYTDPNNVLKTLNFSLTIEGQLNLLGALVDATARLAANGGTITWADKLDTDAIIFSTVQELEDFCRAGLTQKQARLTESVTLKLLVRAVDTADFAADKATIDALVADYIAGVGA